MRHGLSDFFQEAAGRGGHRAGRGRHGEGGNPLGGNPFGGNPFGFGPLGGTRGGLPWALFGRGPRAKRGDVRAGILVLLRQQPRNGYQIMQELEERSQGMWRPSPGSVYPALQLLEDEGLVRSEEAPGGGRLFRLTEKGEKYVDQHEEDLAPPWEAMSGFAARNDAANAAMLIRSVAQAAIQVVRTGTPNQVARARKLLIETRKSLYRLLSEDDGGQE
jgi:DNA-binding PadR family transcriptional regulator